MEQVKVRVPATSANLGPGFDTLGLAYQLYNTVAFAKADEVTITGCPAEFCNPDNLVYRAFKAVLDEAGIPCRGMQADFSDTAIPVCRGLGSSAALLVAGVVAADALYELHWSKTQLLAVAARLEGHPDNVCPALLGGLTAATTGSDGQPIIASYPVSDTLRFVLLVPPFTLSTHLSRGVLPKEVPFADAVFNVSRMGLLFKGFESGDKTLLANALADTLHQPYRRSLIDGFDTAEQLCRENGCIGFCLSGAGPTCLAITDQPGFADRLRVHLAAAGLGAWTVLDPAVDHTGATVL